MSLLLLIIGHPAQRLVSPLFPDIIQCMTIQVLEIKKMVYLYLVNYGRSRPEEVAGALNGFISVSRIHAGADAG